MPTDHDALSIAVAHHQAGRVEQAKEIYQSIVLSNPASAPAWYYLGLAAAQGGDYPTAAGHMEQAIALAPDFAEAASALGSVYQDLNDFPRARDCHRRAVELLPASAEAVYNLGNVCYQLGDFQEAASWYRRATELRPAFPAAYCNWGLALEKQGRLDDALVCYERALALAPERAETHNLIGNIFKQRGQLDDAVRCYQRAIELEPDLADVQHNLSVTLHQQDRLDEAVAAYQRSLRLKPDRAIAWANLANIVRQQGQLDEAADCYRRALEIDPNLAEARWNQATFLLLRGDFVRGWPEYEWRWRTGEFSPRQFQQPRWDGEPLAGKTILLWAEQGLGDTLQFIRYARLVRERGGTVVVECQRALCPLLARTPGIDRVIPAGEALPAFDVQAPLLSLPGILKTTLATIPAAGAYLFADPALIEQWRERLAPIEGFRIGINWRGRQDIPASRNRDVPLDLFASLAELPGVRLISLQHGEEARRELGRVGCAHQICLAEELVGEAHPTDTTHGAFMDTAAIMINLDLVITSDTSIPHLAGGLGVPVWAALPFAPDWRWLVGRSDSPWYPTLRLFRQQKAGDWAGVFREIKAALRELR